MCLPARSNMCRRPKVVVNDLRPTLLREDISARSADKTSRWNCYAEKLFDVTISILAPVPGMPFWRSGNPRRSMGRGHPVRHRAASLRRRFRGSDRA